MILEPKVRALQTCRVFYREVISRGLGAFRARAQRRLEEGEIKRDTLIRFPQLIVAPALTAIMWKSNIRASSSRDFRRQALIQAHIESLFDREERPSGGSDGLLFPLLLALAACGNNGSQSFKAG